LNSGTKAEKENTQNSISRTYDLVITLL